MAALVKASAYVEGEPGDDIFMEEEPQAAVIADIGTDPDGVTLQVTMGGMFAYYEFTWPANDRLTDEAWRAMLFQAPPRPEWVSSFLEGE